MRTIPHDPKTLGPWAAELIGQCRISAGKRAAVARALKQWRYSGSPYGDGAIMNKLGAHVSRLASYLFSPADLRFLLEFENIYPKVILQQGAMGARALTREFERRDFDMQFADSVDMALEQGACIPKIMWWNGAATCKLIPPYQFGVYREDINGLEGQEAVVETSYITIHDFWRRIAHLPNAHELLRKARAAARQKNASDDAQPYFHQIVIAGTSPVVQTASPFTNQPGGFVNVNTDPTPAFMSPEVAMDLLPFHELYVKDDARGDYTTIQIVEPDILIAPYFKHTNMFIPGMLPYGLTQPNSVQGYFWGRSEMADLLKLQSLLRDRMEDIKKIMSLQYDRIYAFIGFEGMNDERYDQMKQAGWIAQDTQGAKVEDLTPELPQGAFTEIETIIRFMDELSGFVPILMGQGDPGVRAGTHASTLNRNASPRLRDRALKVERQCGDLGNTLYELIAAKEARAYWTSDEANGDKGGEFLLSQLPEDRRITVDSHSSSPIYEQDQRETAAFLAKLQAIDGEGVLDLVNVPGRDALKNRYKEMQAQKAKMVAEHPELLTGGKKKAG